MPELSTLHIGIDTGGTFTDFVVFDPRLSALQTFKIPSTPHDPSEAILTGLRTLAAQEARTIIHGSTVATNALLERKGACTALVTTAGFEDVLEIGRQNRPELYNHFVQRPAPLVPATLRFGINERISATGKVQQPLDPGEIDFLLPALQAAGVESVAICTLFSFLDPAHEQRIADRLRADGLFVSLSTEVLPEFREFERTSATVINAYVSPVMAKYLARLESNLPTTDHLQVMQSNGGGFSPASARQQAVRCILSGPAGGLIGAHHIAQQAGVERIITFDMGGTSTDVALLVDRPRLTSQTEIGGLPIPIPMLDIHTVGAGGGSIATIDSGGALLVGPQSAGAVPGPACYGIGDQPTVTDANLVLGRIHPEHFLGGQLPLQPERSWATLETLGGPLGLSPEETALGIIQIANAHMARALQVISVARGHDPRDFTLLCFGGAGGLHAVELARALSIPRVLVPPQAATLSALGMLLADVSRDVSQTVMLPGDTPLAELENRFADLRQYASDQLLSEHIPAADQSFFPALDLRYRGQSYELNVPFAPDFMTTFHHAHELEFGYANDRAQIEIVTLRLRAVGATETPELPSFPPAVHELPIMETAPVWFSNGPQPLPILDGQRLGNGQVVAGPALIIKPDTAILIGPADHARVDSFHNLLIEIAA